MSRPIKLAAATCMACLLTTAAAAGAAQPQLPLVERPAERFERSIEVHQVKVRYHEAVRRATDELERRARRERAAESFALAPGVDQATLDAIAACESGGDPTVVDASGTYYGKYQFDTATWASVGGSGSPAKASEAEQDHRASLLYARAGSSPWPVCGL